ncbi:MAG: hypothetical protein ACFE8E_08470 [Candidatus Hodarchaeota archaeon]
MLLQLTNYVVTYAPIFVYLSFDIVILIFAIFIYRKNSYKYGLYLMISSLISIISYVILIAINYPFLAYTLAADYGFSPNMIGIVYSILGLVFLALGVSSKTLLFLGIYQIYKTHKLNREN